MFQEVFVILLTDFWLASKWCNGHCICSISLYHRKQRNGYGNEKYCMLVNHFSYKFDIIFFNLYILNMVMFTICQGPASLSFT